MALVALFALVASMGCLLLIGFSVYQISQFGFGLKSGLFVLLILIASGILFVAAKLLIEVFFPGYLADYKLSKLPEKSTPHKEYFFEELDNNDWTPWEKNENCASVDRFVKIGEQINFHDYSEASDVYPAIEMRCNGEHKVLVNFYKPSFHSKLYNIVDGVVDAKSEVDFLPGEEKYNIRNPVLLGAGKMAYMKNIIGTGEASLWVKDLSSQEMHSIDLENISYFRHDSGYGHFFIESFADRAFLIVQTGSVQWKRWDYSGHSTYPAQSFVFEIKENKPDLVLQLSHAFGYIKDWKKSENGIEFLLENARNEDEKVLRKVSLTWNESAGRH